MCLEWELLQDHSFSIWTVEWEEEGRHNVPKARNNSTAVLQLLM